MVLASSLCPSAGKSVRRTVLSDLCQGAPRTISILPGSTRLGCTDRYISRILSRSFFFVVICATISFTCAIIVPKRDAAQRNRKIQNIWKEDRRKLQHRIQYIDLQFQGEARNICKLWERSLEEDELTLQ